MIETIYCDLDGVLVDFEKKIREEFGVSSKEFFSKNTQIDAWKKIDKIKNFWYDMEWTDGGKELWKYLQSLSDVEIKILTSPVNLVKNCKTDKSKWVRENLGSDVDVIFSQKKEKYANPQSVLIDDKYSNIQKFKENGGIGIYYTNANKVISKLKQLLEKKKQSNVIGSGDFITLHSDKNWEYIEETPGVAVLPIRIHQGNLEFLFIQEFHGLRGTILTVVTGTQEPGETLLETAARELQEETGYVISLDRFIDVGNIYFSKAYGSAERLFLVIIENEIPGTRTSVDSNEVKIRSWWVPKNELLPVIFSVEDGCLLSILSKALAIFSEF